MAFKKKQKEELIEEQEIDFNELKEETQEDIFAHQESLPVELQINKEEVKEPIRTSSDTVRVVPSCLRKETIRVNFIQKTDTKIQDPKHVLFGGMLETANKILTVPTLRNGNYVNILTDDEKAFLEQCLQLQPNDLSVYKTKDNYWDEFQISIGKEGKTLDLSDPQDYITYKVLLANTAIIAKSFDDINKKASYIFYLSKEGEEAQRTNKTIDLKKRAYMKFGKIEDSYEDLRYVIQIMSNKVLAHNTKKEQLKAWVGEEVDNKPKLFLEIMEDEFYYTKKLIYKGVEYGIVRKQGDFYFTQGENGLIPLSVKGEDPTFKNTVKFLSLPKYQDIRLKIEAKIQKEEE